MTKRIKYFLFIIFTFLMFQPEVSAGSLSIWASASNVTVGQKVTISVNAKNLAGTFNVSSSNNSVLTGGVSGEWLESNTYTYSFTAKSVGKATITVTAVNVADFDTNDSFSGSKSVTLNVVPKKTSSGSSSSSNSSGGTTADKKEYSADNNLKSLTVDGYELAPKFDKEKTEYKLTVDQSVEKLKINATANHEKASVNGAGEVNLSSGENTIEVKVTAENGNEKVYKIVVTVEDLNPIKVKIGEDEYTIVKKNNDLVDKLEYYEEVTIKIDDQDVVAYENANTKVTLVLLKDKDNNIDYYIYNNQKNTYEEYHFIEVGSVTLQLLTANEELENYKKYTLELQEEKINYYKIEKSHKVGLIYGTNVKTGNTGYYVYDENEETLSKYYDEEIKVYQDREDELKNYLMIFMGSVALVAIIIIVISLIKGKKKKKRLHR